MSDIRLDIANGVATLTFNRPERRNAVSLGMLRQFSAALADLADNGAVRVLILTGEGDKAFGAGLDIKEAATLTPEQHAEQHALYEGCQKALAEFPKPLVAAVEGVAAGASLQMALHCDIIVVAEGARIGMPELSAGRPCIMGSYLLASRIGPMVAARLVLGQDWMNAADALAAGLASQVTPGGGALAAATAYAQKIAGTAPQALGATLGWMRELRNGGGGSLAAAFAHADRVLPDAADSDEARAANARFSEKRG